MGGHSAGILQATQGTCAAAHPSLPPLRRLRQGASAPDPLPWDLLMALALVDGLAGDGDAFWESW